MKNVANEHALSGASTGQRGPGEHQRRQQILAAADEHFRHYGYNKTTVADIAKAIGLSSAYVYKFFESKQAIGDAICRLCLGRIEAQWEAIVREQKPAAERLRQMFKSLGKEGVHLFFNERKLHDIVIAASSEKWQSVKDYEQVLLNLIRQVVIEGREAGEFERKTPVDETCRAILLIMRPFSHPVLLEQYFNELDENAALVASLVLRSLSV